MTTTGKTKYIHLRDHGAQENIMAKGGCTIAYKVVGHEVHYAFAECHEKDHYNKMVGRTKAKGRLDSPKWSRRYAHEGNVVNTDIVSILRVKYYEYIQEKYQYASSDLKERMRDPHTMRVIRY